ncbi:TonB family protein [Microbulbifer hainanensis]|uniref:TonB family protein n=1 Tax=Microbulbifer hainanensis TaxID=2735675 RepID=UPI001868FEE8|nr:TonB family protein [Microbulbifer hainanensis]
MKNNLICLIRFVLGASFLLSSIAYSSELGDHFREYQRAVKAKNPEQIAAAAKSVFSVVENYPIDNKNFAAATLNYGNALIAINKAEEAELYLQKSLESHRKIYGDNGIELIDPFLALAKVRAKEVKQSRKKRYRMYIEDALSIAKNSKGDKSLLFATVNLEAGKIALDFARERRARTYLKEAYTAFSGPYKTQAYGRFYSSFYLGKYYLAREQYEKAEPLLMEALDVVNVENGKDGQLELTTRAFLVETYEEMGLQEKSIEQCRAIGKATPFDMDHEPVPLFNRTLEYPKAALATGREGYAVARFTISDAGFAENVEILEANGSSSFGDAAKQYLEQARYAPRFVDGSPVDTPDREIRFNFHLAK